MRSFQHPASEHGTFCFHHVPSQCGYDEVQATKQSYIKILSIEIAKCNSVKAQVTKHVSVTMTSPLIGKLKDLNQNGPKRGIPKVKCSSFTPTEHTGLI